MSSKVYFADIHLKNIGENLRSKVKKLFLEAGFSECFVNNDPVALKIHFGESGSDAFVNPVYVREIVDMVRDRGGKPFLTDSNTLYLGSRGNAIDHIRTAIEHGFNYSVVNAPVIIADGLRGEDSIIVHIGKKHFSKVKISGVIAKSPSMFVISHAKGHEVAGFGGALKNLAMGCASPMGKRDQHSVKPYVLKEKCIGCGNCVSACPKSAITVESSQMNIDKTECIGCFECMTICREKAIDVDWESGIPDFTERMIEYAYGAVSGKENNIGYFNFLIRITPDCDCVPWSDAPIVPDIGVLASRDPVAIDAASLDLINAQTGLNGSRLIKNLEPGGDKFKGIRELTDSWRQIQYAEEIGLGSSNYELITI